MVHHPGHRVCAVDGRSAVAQHFHAVDAVDGDGVGVHRVDRHEAAADDFRLVAGGVDHAASVQQHQRVAGAEVAQVEGADVAACGVHATADVLLLVEVILALLGQHFQHFVAGIDAE